jgi:hypothetical protein
LENQNQARHSEWKLEKCLPSSLISLLAMAKTEQCAFCPAKADDGEHIWSDWFGRLLSPSTFNMIRKEFDGSVLRWRKTKLNEETYVVCGPCNHGWTSNIENEVKQVVRDMAASGHEKTLAHSDIETIAKFTFLKSVVADHSHENFKPFFSTTERWNFRSVGELLGRIGRGWFCFEKDHLLLGLTWRRCRNFLELPSIGQTIRGREALVGVDRIAAIRGMGLWGSSILCCRVSSRRKNNSGENHRAN